MVMEQTARPPDTDKLSQDRLRTLYQIIGRMNSVCELPELLAFLLDQVLQHTGGRRGYLLLAQERATGHGEPHLEIAAIRGEELEEAQAEADVLHVVSRTVAHDVLQHGEPRVIEDLRQDGRYKDRTDLLSLAYKWPSILAIPLRATGRLIGLMYVEHPRRNAFPNPDMVFLSALAEQAAVAIDRAQQGQRRIEELERLNQVSRSVVRVLDLDQVLTRILHEATQMLDVETGSVLLIDAETGELAFRVSVREGQRVRISQRLEMGQGVAGWVAERGEPLLVQDAHRDRRWYGEVEEGFSTHTILCVPLKTDDRIIGVLQVLNKNGPIGFTDRDMALLSAFATSATVAIENARLFAEARQARELRALNEIGSALTASLDLDHVLQIVMEGITSLISVERASIFLVDETSGDLVLEYGLGGEEAIAVHNRWLSAADRERGVMIRLPAPWPGIVGWITRHGLPVAANEVRRDPRFLPDIDAITHFDTRSILGAPLGFDDRIIGAIELLNKRDGPFTTKERDLLVAFSKWAAIALHNARLYRELDEAKARLASAEAIAVMSDMALNMTHRLNNRISAARIAAARIESKCQAELRNPYLAQKVDQIRRVTAESLNIIRRIRQPFEVADLEPVDVSDCLAEALSTFRLKPDIKLIASYQPELPQVMATPEKLIETFCQVIGNALDAIAAKEAGQLRIETHQRPGRLVEVIVADDGAGIPPEVQAHVFEPFFTTKEPEAGGLGLGLWLTRIYVGRLGGQVKLDSTPGQGTTVRIQLPAAKESMA
jgi:GAF domain-containing protein